MADDRLVGPGDAEGRWLDAVERAERDDFSGLETALADFDLPMAAMTPELRLRLARLLRVVRLTAAGAKAFHKRDFAAERAAGHSPPEAFKRAAKRWRMDWRSFANSVRRSRRRM